jgi:hypothetical protein
MWCRKTTGNSMRAVLGVGGLDEKTGGVLVVLHVPYW